MRGRRNNAMGLLVGAALASLTPCLGGACATNPIPGSRRISPEESITSGKGAYVLLELTTHTFVSGELIAAADGWMSILTDDGRLLLFEFPRVARATLGVHDNNEGSYVLWTVAGSLSTISHGAWLIFSLPVWLLSGIPSTVAESHRGIFECPDNTGSKERLSLPRCLAYAGTYARFPQGLPAGVDAARLLGRSRPKPETTPAAPAAAETTPVAPAAAPAGPAKALSPSSKAPPAFEK